MRTTKTVLIALLVLIMAAPLGAQKAAPAAKAPAQEPARKAAPAAPAAPGARAAKEWNQLHYPPLRELKLPEIKRYTLANGIRLFVVEDHRLPLVDGVAMIRTGSRWEPADMVGLASIAGQVMRTGGTRSKTGDELDQELEAIAASVESSVGPNSGLASFSALKGDEDRVLDIFAGVLMNPEFRQDKIDLAKTFARTGIARRNDDAGGISAREFRRLLYGPDSPYARTTEYATIDAVKREDLIAFHRRYYHPNNVMIGISGDVDADVVRQKMEKAFAAWKPEPDLQVPPVPGVTPPGVAPVNFVRKEDVNQASVRIGHLDGMMKDPDFFALEVMSQILGGGGFSSRITKHVRSEMGLAYAAGGDWNAGYDHPGTFSIFVGTKSETTVKAIEAVMKELRDIREKEVTDEEMKIAKESILNSFVFNFADPGQIMRRLMTYIYYGYPEDFLEQYKKNIEKVTKADVLRVAQQHLNPDRATILVVGNDKDFDKPLTALALSGGTVHTIDITIPQPKGAAAAGPATAEALERGRAVFAAAQRAAGGAERLRSLTDVSLAIQAKFNTPQGQFDSAGVEKLVFPGTLRSERKLPFGDIVIFYDGSTGWVSGPQGAQELPGSMKENIHAQLVRNTYVLLRGGGEFTVQFEKREKVGDTEADVILVTKDGESVRLYVDPARGTLLKKTYRGSTPMGGAAEVEELYSDYREVAGISVPFRFQVKHDGSPFIDATVTDVKFNTGLKPEELAKKP